MPCGDWVKQLGCDTQDERRFSLSHPARLPLMKLIIQIKELPTSLFHKIGRIPE
jgi:hypothetical protein